MDVNEIRSEEDALDQSMALTKIVMNLLKTKAKESKRIWVALILSLLLNVCTVAGFLWYASGVETTETVTTTVEQDTGEGTGNNIYQSGEQAHYSEGNE